MDAGDIRQTSSESFGTLPGVDQKSGRKPGKVPGLPEFAAAPFCCRPSRRVHRGLILLGSNLDKQLLEAGGLAAHLADLPAVT